MKKLGLSQQIVWNRNKASNFAFAQDNYLWPIPKYKSSGTKRKVKHSFLLVVVYGVLLVV